jgi:hypothetical protein
MLLCGLVLLGLGGCFLIGILALLRPALVAGGPLLPASAPVSLSGDERVLLVTLYAFAFATFAAAVLLFVLGVRGLWRVLHADGQTGED